MKPRATLFRSVITVITVISAIVLVFLLGFVLLTVFTDSEMEPEPTPVEPEPRRVLLGHREWDECRHCHYHYHHCPRWCHKGSKWPKWPKSGKRKGGKSKVKPDSDLLSEQVKADSELELHLVLH